MQDRREYWNDKDKRAAQAVLHTREMEHLYQKEIEASVAGTSIYGPELPHKTPGITGKKFKARVLDIDSVGAVMGCKGNNVAVLNFASYKNPGGMFIKGSKAQEECLCHASTLYNVLQRFDLDDRSVPFKADYYGWNRKNKNRSLYTHRALYTPWVVFTDGKSTRTCDVITCAAPNKSAAQKYCGVSDAENRKVLWERIQFIYRIAEINQVNTLILGAFGCGVFGQDPHEVATLFKAYLTFSADIPFLEDVIFAIPYGANGNLKVFRETFGK